MTNSGQTVCAAGTAGQTDRLRATSGSAALCTCLAGAYAIAGKCQYGLITGRACRIPTGDLWSRKLALIDFKVARCSADAFAAAFSVCAASTKTGAAGSPRDAGQGTVEAFAAILGRTVAAGVGTYFAGAARTAPLTGANTWSGAAPGLAAAIFAFLAADIGRRAECPAGWAAELFAVALAKAAFTAAAILSLTAAVFAANFSSG